jgi:hypothetical protein
MASGTYHIVYVEVYAIGDIIEVDAEVDAIFLSI